MGRRQEEGQRPQAVHRVVTEIGVACPGSDDPVVVRDAALVDQHLPAAVRPVTRPQQVACVTPKDAADRLRCRPAKRRGAGLAVRQMAARSRTASFRTNGPGATESAGKPPRLGSKPAMCGSQLPSPQPLAKNRVAVAGAPGAAPAPGRSRWVRLGIVCPVVVNGRRCWPRLGKPGATTRLRSPIYSSGCSSSNMYGIISYTVGWMCMARRITV